MESWSNFSNGGSCEKRLIGDVTSHGYMVFSSYVGVTKGTINLLPSSNVTLE